MLAFLGVEATLALESLLVAVGLPEQGFLVGVQAGRKMVGLGVVELLRQLGVVEPVAVVSRNLDVKSRATSSYHYPGAC
jgi:hypothetical protein